MDDTTVILQWLFHPQELAPANELFILFVQIGTHDVFEMGHEKQPGDG
jgi:hypothetical protein